MAKIIIDVPNSMQEMCKWHKQGINQLTNIEIGILIDAMVNGVVLPDNATNGDIITSICPAWIEIKSGDIELTIKQEVWNAKYKGGDKDDK